MTSLWWQTGKAVQYRIAIYQTPLELISKVWRRAWLHSIVESLNRSKSLLSVFNLIATDYCRPSLQVALRPA